MSYKVARDSALRCVGCGPNDVNYDPLIPVGGTLTLSDVWVNVDPTADETRVATIDDNIRTTTIGTATPKSVAELKAMDWPTYSAWFDLNFDVASKLIGLLKRIFLIVIRRVL